MVVAADAPYRAIVRVVLVPALAATPVAGQRRATGPRLVVVSVGGGIHVVRGGWRGEVGGAGAWMLGWVGGGWRGCMAWRGGRGAV